MKKLGIIVDSFSGLTQEQANEKGYRFLPLRIEIDGVFYEDGKEIDSQDLLKKLTTETKVKTSLPNYNLIVQTIEETSNEYDDVIYLGVSKELSNTFSQFISVASEKNNVYAMENHLFGNQIIRVVEYFKKLYENGASINELYSKLNDINETSRTFIVPKNLQFIVNGGRLSGLLKEIYSILFKNVPYSFLWLRRESKIYFN
ncbi:DegV family protein [Mycoplasmopsis felis]|uniref:DegV family protein n=1 Tax=Mycoplasmopsis felis TaxID=33923 RepID=UPI0021E00BE6|nr:DegV family protein [Mycoplasmopsis felis]MCU9939862.1 DegV family protein [Mycoplasmopsis felis]